MKTAEAFGFVEPFLDMSAPTTGNRKPEVHSINKPIGYLFVSLCQAHIDTLN